MNDWGFIFSTNQCFNITYPLVLAFRATQNAQVDGQSFVARTAAVLLGGRLRDSSRNVFKTALKSPLVRLRSSAFQCAVVAQTPPNTPPDPENSRRARLHKPNKVQ